MADQLHIRDASTVARIRALATAKGLSMKDVVAEAVRRFEIGFDEGLADPAFDELLARDQAATRHIFQGSNIDEALYDSTTGLPR
jgi:hypothetical protein